jgi:hypothetical protein
MASIIVFKHHILLLTCEWAQTVDCYTTQGWAHSPVIKRVVNMALVIVFKHHILFLTCG